MSIVDAIKETYLVGKFIYKTIGSAIHEKEERDEVERTFSFELLRLRTFAGWFVRKRKVILEDPDLDAQWLDSIIHIFERLSGLFGEYRSIAEASDNEYKTYSPVLNKSIRQTGKIEFRLEDTPTPSRDGMFSKLFTGTRRNVDQSRFMVGSKWALFQKSRIERVVVSFRKRNEDLEKYLMLAMANQQQEFLTKTFMEGADAGALRVSKHAQLKHLIQVPQTNTKLELDPRSHELNDMVNDNGLSEATLYTTIAKGNVYEDQVLVEYKSYAQDLPSDDADQEDDAVRQNLIDKTHNRVLKLATLLEYSGAQNLGTLPLRGILAQMTHHRVAFLFEYPTWAVQDGGWDLSAAIVATKDEPWPLGVRFQVAHRFTELIGNFHICRWLHKNISSRSLAFFIDSSTSQIRETDPYLVNFEYSRPDSGSTARIYDADPQKDLYRHPAIQKLDRPSFRRVHDIYSLGVVLLEIAVWQRAADIVAYAFPDAANRSPEALRKHYIKLAHSQIPHRMGAAYLEAVLMCLEPDNERQFSGNEFAQNFRIGILDMLSPKLLLPAR